MKIDTGKKVRLGKKKETRSRAKRASVGRLRREGSRPLAFDWTHDEQRALLVEASLDERERRG